MLAAAETAEGRLLAARVVLQGATPCHASLAQDPEATREVVRAELIGLGLGEQVWLEKVEVRTGPTHDLESWQAGSDAAATLLRVVQAAPSPEVAAAAQDYAKHMLGRAARLRDALGADHPAVRAAAGEVPPDLLQRARALLLARLVEG